MNAKQTEPDVLDRVRGLYTALAMEGSADEESKDWAPDSFSVYFRQWKREADVYLDSLAEANDAADLGLKVVERLVYADTSGEYELTAVDGYIYRGAGVAVLQRHLMGPYCDDNSDATLSVSAVMGDDAKLDQTIAQWREESYADALHSVSTEMMPGLLAYVAKSALSNPALSSSTIQGMREAAEAVLKATSAPAEAGEARRPARTMKQG